MIYGNKDGSPGKIAARAIAYASIPRKDFWQKKHIVIASRDCADIKYLLDCKVPPTNIVACDTDPVALSLAKNYRVCTSSANIQGTVAHLMRFPSLIISINIDLCFALINGLPILREVCEVIPQEYKGKIFYTFERGRDRQLNFKSTEERVKYLCAYLKKELDWNQDWKELLRTGFEYTSFTLNSKGSPMMMVSL